MKRKSLLAASIVVAGAVSAAVPSIAADLGGECCADLEERIAELEATTARKGNRKVSLTVSGWVTQQVMFWDDGIDRNVYVHDLGTTLGSHFKFSGAANFAPGWNAGYVLHIEGLNSDGLTHDQDNDTGPAVFGNPQIHNSYWFISSEQMGKFSLGLQSQASDNAAILVDGSGSAIPANWVAFDVANFVVQRPGGGFSSVTWSDAGSCKGMGGAWGDCNGLPRKVARYDSPVFGGFSASASWGEDDMWDVAARYSGVVGDFKVAAAVAYAVTSDGEMTSQLDELKYLQAGAYVEHVPSGLFAYGAYGQLDAAPFIAPSPLVTSILQFPDAETFYAKGGLRQRWTTLGATVLYGEYLRNTNGMALSSIDQTPGFSARTDVTTSLDVWGVGIVQEIDAAAMSLWIKYRRMSFDLDVQVVEPVNFSFSERFEDFHYVGAGALINF